MYNLYAPFAILGKLCNILKIIFQVSRMTSLLIEFLTFTKIFMKNHYKFYKSSVKLASCTFVRTLIEFHGICFVVLTPFSTFGRIPLCICSLAGPFLAQVFKCYSTAGFLGASLENFEIWSKKILFWQVSIMIGSSQTMALCFLIHVHIY